MSVCDRKHNAQDTVSVEKEVYVSETLSSEPNAFKTNKHKCLCTE